MAQSYVIIVLFACYILTPVVNTFQHQLSPSKPNIEPEALSVSLSSSSSSSGEKTTTLTPRISHNGQRRREDKFSFRIGLIIPRTAFTSQYKTYTQRITQTFSHLLQLSRLKNGGGGGVASTITGSFQSGPNPLVPPFITTAAGFGGQSSGPASIYGSYVAQQAAEKVPTSCETNSQQYKRAFHWTNLTFNRYFNIKVVDSVDLAPRSSAQDIIDSMCQKLIEQNVSVIVYLENNQDQAVVLHESESKAFSGSQSRLTTATENRQLELESTSSRAPTKSKIKVVNEAQKVSSQAHFIMHLAQSAGIPMITWSVTAALAQRPKKQRTLHLAPTVSHEAQAMLAIMKRYSWYSFSVVTTTLAGYEDFILALRQSISTSKGTATTTNSAAKATTEHLKVHHNHYQLANTSSSSTPSSSTLNLNSDGDNANKATSSVTNPELEVSEKQPSRTFRLLDVITIKEQKQEHIEGEMRKLMASESRVILLYSSKGEAIDILRVARKLELTRRSYAWIVAQSVIGPDDNDRAPPEFHPGLWGIYFRSNHERLLDELSRAITIIAHGLEGLVRDVLDNSQVVVNGSESVSKSKYRRNLLESGHSRCSGKLDTLSEQKGDLLFEYLRRSSPSNVFDADGSLRDVELNVVNLDKERQWRKIGCFSDATLTIDDITWPEQSERPPSGTMEKFHLRAVFLEEPSFVNIADPDTETGECKTNRAVRCRYKVARPTMATNNSTHPQGLDLTSTVNVSSSNESSSNRSVSRNKEELEYKCCSGFCIDLMAKLSSDLQFTYDLYRVPDGVWGILENNTWNGLIGEIVKNQADIIVTSTKLNSDRQKAVDFTVPFLDSGISILVAKQTGVISKLAFLEPFDTLAWIMFICVGIPLAATSIFYFEVLSPNGFYARVKQTKRLSLSQESHASKAFHSLIAKEHQKFSFCRTLWLVINILFGSAAHIDSPKGYTARFMSNVWATTAIVFLAIYTANLAAFMITREEYLELTGIGDAKLAYPYYKQPPLKFGTISGGNTHAVLSKNRPNLYNYMSRFNRVNVEDGVNAVKTGQLDAFIYDSLVLEHMASQDPECKLVNVGSWYSMTGYGLAFARDSRYYDKFNMKMLEYRKNGELDRLRRFWLQGLCKPGQSRHSISKPLDLSQFMSAFLLLGGGILCSVFIFVLEHLYIIYLRDKLLNSSYRKRLVKVLYPFSLSLADTLRLPEDDKNDDDDVDKNDPTVDHPERESSSLDNNLKLNNRFKERHCHARCSEPLQKRLIDSLKSYEDLVRVKLGSGVSHLDSGLDIEQSIQYEHEANLLMNQLDDILQDLSRVKCCDQSTSTQEPLKARSRPKSSAVTLESDEGEHQHKQGSQNIRIGPETPHSSALIIHSGGSSSKGTSPNLRRHSTMSNLQQTSEITESILHASSTCFEQAKPIGLTFAPDRKKAISMIKTLETQDDATNGGQLQRFYTETML